MSSDLLLPSGAEMKASLEEVLKKGGIPQPQGWKILIAMPDYAKVTKGGIHLSEEYVEREETASPVGLVVALGPACYMDSKKFPAGAYCKAGDFVIVHPYSGTRIVLHGKEFRFINDDTVQAVVSDPSAIKRV